MPALDVSLMKSTIKASLISAGLVQYTYDNNGNAIPSGEIATNLETIVNAISDGFSIAFEAWRVSQSVVGTATVATAPGVAPVAGNIST